MFHRSLGMSLSLVIPCMIMEYGPSPAVVVLELLAGGDRCSCSSCSSFTLDRISCAVTESADGDDMVISRSNCDLCSGLQELAMINHLPLAQDTTAECAARADWPFVSGETVVAF